MTSSPRARRRLLLLPALLVVAMVPTVPAHAAYPGRNGVIAFSRGADIWTVNPDGSGLRNLTSTPDVQEDQPSISPDGTRVAFQSSKTGVGVVPQIDVANVDGSGRRAVAVPGGPLHDAHNPTWSPDGTRIAFDGYHNTERQHVIWVAAADGSGGGQLTTGFGASEPSWSVRNEIVVRASGGLFVVDAATGAERLLTNSPPYNYKHPDWAPDGSRVVFTCGVDEGACAVDADGSGFVEITHPTLSEGGSAPSRRVYAPHFSPDGTLIVFSGEDPHGDSGTHLHTMPVSGLAPDNSGSTQLTTGASAESNPDWGPAPSGAPQPAPAPAPAPAPEPTGPDLPRGGFDGDPATTERVDRSAPRAAAIAISRARFDDSSASGRHADAVVLSREDSFPDSLAGSALTGTAPMLFTATAGLSADTAAEIDRLLDPGAVVYLLGGRAALGAAVEQALVASGYRVVRLAGPSRVETALAVATEVKRLNPSSSAVLLARAGSPADNPTAAWADSVSAGGIASYAAVPILLTDTAGMHPAVSAWLRQHGTQQTVLLGGTAALSDDVWRAAPGSVRMSGAERTETAAAIAEYLWPDEDGRHFVVINGFEARGWAFGLAAAGLAADAEAPVLLVNSDITAATAGLVGTCGSPEVDVVLVGDHSAIHSSFEAHFDALDGGAC